MAYGKVELCGVDSAQLPVLSEDEKRTLLQKVREGDKEARQRMIEGNLRLVLSVVQRFSGRSENLDDLFQVGCIGLMKAIDNFDPGMEVRFSTYGVPMIIGEIRRFLRDDNSLRVSRSVRDTAYHAMQAREYLQKETGREPSLAEISKSIELPVSQVAQAMDSVCSPISLYEPVYKEEGDAVYVMDQIRDTSGEENWISDMMFRDSLQKLTDREKKIIALRYMAGKTQMDVAHEIGISQAQVSRLEKAAIHQIREAME